MTDDKAIGYLFIFAVLLMLIGIAITMICREDDKGQIADCLTLIFIAVAVAIMWGLNL